MFHLRRPNERQLAALVADQAARQPSYDDIGQSLAGGPPDGYHWLRETREVGRGRHCFEQATDAIRSWAGHRHTGAILHPPTPDLAEGETLALALRLGPVWATAACRIVVLVDEADRFGFAYGTLPHHPERGEETFLVVHDPTTDAVRFEVAAFSQPSSLLTRLGGPVARSFQRFMARRYLEGFRRATTGC